MNLDSNPDIERSLSSESLPAAYIQPDSAFPESAPAESPADEWVTGVEPLAPVFPLDAEGTNLVLYDVGHGELRVRWSLGRDDLERYVSSFPVDGGRPAPVLRLCRGLVAGGSELVHELSLLQVARERAGDAGFRVGTDASIYHAELGLAARDGGWLMLARSNRLIAAADLGLRLELGAIDERRSTVVLPGDLPFDLSLGAGSSQLDDSDHPAPSAREGALVPEFPLAALDSDVLVLEPPEALATRVGEGLAQRFVATRVARRQVPPDTRGAPQAELPREQLAVAPSSVPNVSDPAHEPTVAESPRQSPAAPQAWSDYGSPPQRLGTLVLEAELHIDGQAMPGTLIDLFGYSFRVGPGGRFHFKVRVQDPDILRRALAHEPPVELIAARERES